MMAFPYYYNGYNQYSTMQNPTSYQMPYNAPQQPVNAQTQQTVQQPMQGGVVWVQGENAAKSYLVAPNTTIFLMDSEKPIFYIKTADASGVPLPLRKFSYAEITEGKTADPPKQASDQFITREEFDAFKKQVMESEPPAGKKKKKEDVNDD